MRVFNVVLSAILLAIVVYQYRHGYVRGWSFMRQGGKKTRAENPVSFWAILVAEIIGAVYLLIRAPY